MRMSARVTQAAMRILQKCNRIAIGDDAYGLSMPEIADREIYMEVAEILRRCGYKWNKKQKTHLASESEDYDLLLDVIATGDAPPANPLAYFPTPEHIAQSLAQHCAVCLAGVTVDGELFNSRILEPSAGTGALIDAFIDVAARSGHNLHCDIVAIEIDPLRARILKRKYAKDLPEGLTVEVICADFNVFARKEIAESAEFDAILANPPFSAEGKRKLWRMHLELMLQLMSSRARIGIVLPQDCDRDDADTKFLEFFSACQCQKYGKGAFKDAGTMFPTVGLFGDNELILDRSWDGQSLWVENTEILVKEGRAALDHYGRKMCPQLRQVLLKLLREAARNGEHVLMDDIGLSRFLERLNEYFVD